MKYQFVYLNVVTVCLNELGSVCLNGRAGQGKPSRIFKCSYCSFIIGNVQWIIYGMYMDVDTLTWD